MNQNQLFSFLVVPTPIHYYTFVPMSPPTPDIKTASSENCLNSGFFNSYTIDHLYYTQEHLNYRTGTSTTLAELPPSEPISQLQHPTDRALN